MLLSIGRMPTTSVQSKTSGAPPTWIVNRPLASRAIVPVRIRPSLTLTWYASWLSSVCTFAQSAWNVSSTQPVLKYNCPLSSFLTSPTTTSPLDSTSLSSLRFAYRSVPSPTSTRRIASARLGAFSRVGRHRTPEGRKQVGRHPPLEDVAHRADVAGGLDELRIVVDRQEDDAHRPAAFEREEAFRRFEAGQVRHRDVEHGEIGFEQRRGGHRRFAFVDGRDDLEFLSDQAGDALEHAGMIVGEQHTRA